MKGHFVPRSPVAIILVFLSLSFLVGDSGKKDRPADRADKDYKDELPRIPPTKPTEALKTFRLRPGFRIELAAAEPTRLSPCR